MAGGLRGRGGGSSLVQKLDFMPSIDVLTAGVLALDLYILHQGLSDYMRDSVFTVSGNPQVIAIQLTAVTLLVYVIETVADYKAEH